MAKNYTFPQLALMDWVMEKQGRFYTHPTLGSVKGISLFEMAPPGEDGKREITSPFKSILPTPEEREREHALLRRLGGRLTADYSRLAIDGIVMGLTQFTEAGKLQKFKAALSGIQLHYSDSVNLVTASGREWWAHSGKALYEAARERIEADAASADRLVVIMRPAIVSPVLTPAMERAKAAGVIFPSMSQSVDRPYAIARVVKETEKRVYVEDVVFLIPEAKHNFRTDPLGGRAPNVYVERESIMLDNATRAGASRLVEADREMADDIQRIALDTLERLVPMMVEQDLRMKQKMGEREDVMRELLESLRDEAQARLDARAVEDTVPAGPGR
jgi:hypothetical protein